MFLGREGLLHLVIVPVLLNVALAVGSAWAAARYWHQEVAHRQVGSPFLEGLLMVVATAIGAIVLFILFQPILGAVFNDYLAERVERKVAGEVPKVSFFASSGRALVHGILKLFFYGLALVVGMLLTALTGIGALVGVALGGLFLAYDGFDFPLSRRKVGFGAKWRYLALHPGQTIGYGLGATALYFVPLALVVAPPFAAAGATLLYLETENRKKKTTT
jgi:uncharacterized protein involved in cysteine biosynthesis